MSKSIEDQVLENKLHTHTHTTKKTQIVCPTVVFFPSVCVVKQYIYCTSLLVIQSRHDCLSSDRNNRQLDQWMDR